MAIFHAGTKLILLVLAAACILACSSCSSFGANPTKEDRAEYAARAKNFDGKKFKNENELDVMGGDGSSAADKKISHKEPVPKNALPLAKPDFSRKDAADEVSVTWLGHSSLLMQMHGMNILIDPVFGSRSSPVGFAGPKRFCQPPIALEELPEIDILIVSHDHYDHLDYKTILNLDGRVARYVVPLGVEKHLEKWGVAKGKITKMAWWEETVINGLTIGCAPARHFSGRSLWDWFSTLWASWVFKDERHLIFESGDSGFDRHYEEIHEKYGDFDFVMPDCAQYNVKWPSVHQTPEEAFEAIRLLGARRAMPIHWGAFKLSDHPWDDPAVRMTEAARDSGIIIATPKIGETLRLSEIESYQSRWYEEVE